MKSKTILSELENEFLRIKEQIIKKIGPDKIILFGSLAKKQASLTSDIDIIIIKNSKSSFKERMNELYTVIDYRYPTDMFYYTPEEVSRMKQNNSFVRKSLNEGVVVYEK